ncbi:MAG: transcription elongation factor GreA [Clostridia bacterium]|nr:transcription elongation factor GreA [Clostridia bacterium]
MAAKPTFVTEEGLQKLKDELEHLKVVKRKEVAEALKQAKAFGDLSENSEYDEAKNEQAEVERHIAELEDILENIEIIKSTGKKNKIQVGSKVKVYDVEFDEEVIYTIVGSTESDPMENKISDESPIGKALLGAKPGDEVQAETPGGAVKMRILEIL